MFRDNSELELRDRVNEEELGNSEEESAGQLVAHSVVEGIN